MVTAFPMGRAGPVDEV